MARHSSATPREEESTPRRGEGGRGDAETGGRGDGVTESSSLKSHSIESPSVKSHNIQSQNIDAALKRRARLLITNSSIPRQTRSLIRYALEIKDPHLAQVVHRVEGGE